MVVAISTLVNSSQIAGLGKYILYLIGNLQKIDTDHEFIILVNKDFDKLINIKNPKFKKVLINIPHSPRCIMRPYYFFWQNLLAKNLFKKYSVDVFHSPNPIPIRKKLSIPYVVTIHDLGGYSFKRYSSFRGAIRKAAIASSAKCASQILTVSDFTKKEIIQYLNKDSNNIYVTNPGLTVDVDESSDIPSFLSKPYFLHVGGTRPNKNVERIIDAFLEVRIDQDMELYIVGESGHLKLKEEVKERYRKKGIFIRGYLPEVELLVFYQNAVALVYPSLFEGFGLPITEAMACGTPVITSNITSMPEVGGDAAHYVDPYSVDSIREGMEKLLNDEEYRNSLVKKGLERYKKFSWEEAAKKTIEVYEKAARQ